jgi:hypothetical protein
MISWTPEEKPSLLLNLDLDSYTGKFMDTSYWQTDVLCLGSALYLYDYSYPPTDDPRDNLRYLDPRSDTVFKLTGPGGGGEAVTFSKTGSGQIENIKIGANYIYPIAIIDK